MTTEEKLKEFILSKYRSIREFTQAINMPYSTMTTILKKGVNYASIQNIIKICQALDISADALAEGNIVLNTKASADQKRIEDIIRCTEEILLNTDNLTLEGKPATKEDVYLIISTLEAVLDIRKRQNEKLEEYYRELTKKEG